MLRPRVDLQLVDLPPREPVLREHPFHSGAQHLLGPALELLAQRAAANPARVARVTDVALLIELVAGDVDLFRIDHDHEIAGVDVRRVGRLAFSAQRVGDPGRQAAEGLTLGVDEVPLAGDLTGFRVVGLHASKGRRKTPPPGPNRSNPWRKAVPPPWDGWRTYGAPVTCSASRPTARTRRPRASSSRNVSEAATSAEVGRRFVVSVPGCVGTTF